VGEFALENNEEEIRMIKKTLAKSKALTFCMLVATSVTMSLPLVATEPAHAATTFIVTSTGDEADVNLNDFDSSRGGEAVEVDPFR
jgi:hypothetical protein